MPSSPQRALNPVERKALKAAAHALDPVVIIGDAGLTPGVLAEIDRSLTAHELIKVRVAGDDREERLAYRDRIVEELHAEPVQVIGKLLVLFRAAPEEPKKAPVATKRVVRADPSRVFNRKISPRKLLTGDAPPRTERVRKSGQRSTKKPHQNR